MNYSENAQISFEKRPKGWFISLTEFAPSPKRIKNEMIWDRDSSIFKDIDFVKQKEEPENKDLITTFLNDWSKKFYKICPYYGYPGWDIDVINEFGQKEELSDTVLYGLGRAYSSYAGGFLNNNSGLADTNLIFKLASGKNCMSKVQLEKYRNYRHLAIETYKKLAERNPDFETTIGTIETKTANEYMTAFLDLRVYQNEQEASKEIIDGIYSDFYISLAKNYLNSCAPNAVLFTNGDNDTYPLLYVQAKNGVRKDVMVVNISLLNTERYISSLREKVLDAPGLQLTLTKEELSGSKRDFVLIEPKDEKAMDLNEMIAFVKNDENTYASGGMNYYYVPANKFSLNTGESSFSWEVKGHYLLRSQLIILDLMASEKLKRPLCFAVTLPSEDCMGMDDFMSQEGLAYRLTTEKKIKSDGLFGRVNTEIMYENLMVNFDWSGIELLDNTEKKICLNYRNIFHHLAKTLIEDNQPEKAKEVLDKCIEIFPDDLLKFDYSVLDIIEDYYKLGKFEKANIFARQLINNLKNNLDNFPDLPDAKRAEYKKTTTKKLKDIAFIYNQPEIAHELDGK
jgi:tetratricopeptide (TPR) repeat protein